MLLLEFKTASSFRFAPYTMRSLQTGSYQWAANVIPDFAKYGPIVGMLYRFMWKRIPDDPKWLEKSGRYSRNMSIKSTAEWVRYAIEYAGHDPKEYRDFILALDERGNDFFMQRVIHRTPQQIDDITRAIYEFGKMMCDPDVPIFEQGGFHCSYCPFADPCALREKGMDYEGLLAAEYNTRDYWEESEE